MLDSMEARGIRPKIRYCCNSAAALLHPEYAMDLVRPGIATYGYMPDPGLKNELGLRPLFSWKTTVVQVRELAPGVSLGYDQTWTAPRKSRIATLPVGYGDGLNRQLSNRITFQLNGHTVRQVGRICMDMCMVDVTDLPDVRVGDEVTILGGADENGASCEAMAEMLGSITYEVTCNINKRVPQLYYLDGEEVEKQQYII